VWFFTLLLPGAAMAGPTGLTIIPIADVLGHREFLFSMGSTGTDFDVTQRRSDSHSLEFGLGDRLELGYDNDFLGSTVFNAKLQVIQGKGRAVSVGAMNWNSGSMTPFVDGRLDGKGYRLHAGWMKDSKKHLIGGIDFPVFAATGDLEYISGPKGAVWAGLSIPFAALKGLTVGLGAGVSVNGKSQLMHSVSVGYGFKL
jgi:hypothetical protein